MNLNAFLVAPALEHWLFHDDWHFDVFCWWAEQANHLFGIDALNGLLSQKTEDALVQSDLHSMDSSYPFDLFQQGLDEHSQMEAALRFLLGGVLVKIINADGIDLMDDDRL